MARVPAGKRQMGKQPELVKVARVGLGRADIKPRATPDFVSIFPTFPDLAGEQTKACRVAYTFQTLQNSKCIWRKSSLSSLNPQSWSRDLAL